MNIRPLFQSCALLLALALPGQAMAAECLTRAQATALITYVVPDAVSALAERCNAQSAPGGFFSTGLDQWLGSARTTAEGFWPDAKIAFFRVADMDADDPIIGKLPDSAIQGMLGPLVGATITQEIKEADCGSVERMIELIAPLPVQNLGALTTEILSMDKPKPGKKSDLSICPQE